MPLFKSFATANHFAWNVIRALAALPLLVMVQFTRLMVSVLQCLIPRLPRSSLKNYCVEMLTSLTGQSNGSPSHTPKI